MYKYVYAHKYVSIKSNLYTYVYRRIRTYKYISYGKLIPKTLFWKQVTIEIENGFSQVTFVNILNFE